MPLQDRFFCFENGRIKQVTMTTRDLGTQNDLLRSLMQPSPFIINEITLPAYEVLKDKDMELGVFKFSDGKIHQTRARFFGKRKPVFAVTDTLRVSCFNIETLPIKSTFVLEPDGSGDFTLFGKVMHQRGMALHIDNRAIETTLLLPLPKETWITVSCTRSGDFWILSGATMETYTKQGMRTPTLVNIFDNGNICLGEMDGISENSWDKLMNKFFDMFFASFWNDHIMRPSQDYWVRWTQNGEYIEPVAAYHHWSKSTGTANSGYIAESYKHDPLP